MKALRRSIKGEKPDTKVQHISLTPKSAVAIVPPKKVIRALYDYEAQSNHELGFTRGDFFHVIGRENDSDWYEACNPAVPDARGLVPVAYFQALGKTERDSGQSISDKSPMGMKVDHDSGYSDMSGSGTLASPPDSGGGQRFSKTMKGTGAMVYGVVMYDFAAERPDELEAKAGEAIIVIAQSNPEWFVAKPIGRLGGPGLIPVDFIEIRDMSTGKAVPNAQEAVQRAGVPKVEEWKRMAADYKNSSITLGKFEASNGSPQQQQQQQQMQQNMERMSLQQNSRQSQQNGQNYDQRQSQQAKAAQPVQQVPQNPYSVPTKSASQLYAPISARIPRYCFAEDKYWFVIEAALEDGRHWELSRYYEDFYDFQIALLTEFPAEAGNTGTQKRSLPYMPGPVNYVTDAITEGRQHNLDAYVKSLLTQPPYISRCTLVKQFFAPREGDYEMDPNAVEEEYRLSGGSQQSSNDSRTQAASRQSSRGDLNGETYSSGVPTGLTAAPGHQRGQSSLSVSNGQGPTRQTSSLSQPSSNSLSPGVNANGQQPSASAMKVKIYFGDDLIAIRVPTDIQFRQLYDKISDRLKIPQGDEIALYYKDEPSGEKPNLMSDNDLDVALQRNDKLIIYVEYQ